MSFLKAEWRKLIMVNYVIPPQILQKYVPKGTDLDLWNDNCYLSLVGFMFQNTQVLGVKIPFHVNFEEVNLRFYVKRREEEEIKRGVVFIKEIVPKPAITLVANSLYKENYETQKMDHNWDFNEELRASYRWTAQNHWQNIRIVAENVSSELEEGSEAEFIAEHYWGYAKVSDSKTMEYEVTHPKWKKYPVKEFIIDVDFEKVYGKEFSILNTLKPKSVFFVEGSEITVEKNRLIA